ncbi:lipocalin family protein [uncultured Croceitalea sp.]|uniref:lipocalin family protein n=1 Tax=uncultured Croceitalea sp. TaxID=1798908 RepID=UPI003305CBA4
MKKVLIVFFLIGFVSCSDDNEVEDDSLNGLWTLTNVSCFCGFPDPPEFNLTQVTFVASNNEVIVLNTGSHVYFREDGTYSYSGNGNRITLENENSYDFEITGNTMQLIFVDQPGIADDEVTYSFIRN